MVGGLLLVLLAIAHPPVSAESWLSPLRLDALSGWLVGLLAIVLGYQQRRLYVFRRGAARREELFRVVAENAADMIALVDVRGHRLYNSPAYEKVLGYTPEELAKTSAFEQIHPEDRYRVLQAAREARRTGIGKKLEYRIRHKNGNWLVLESSASVIRDALGEVEKLVIVNRDITERKRAEEQLEHNSVHDMLTGLPNRRLFLERLEHCRERAQRNPDYQYAVMVADVDDFSVFNETLGRAAGDRMIVEVSRRLEGCLRHSDMVARSKNGVALNDVLLSRMGGDEFTILLEGIVDPSDAVRVARRVQEALAVPWEEERREVLATVSVGIALSASLNDRAEDLLRDADTAMRRAKSLGGSRCEVFDESMHTQAMNRLQLEAELRTALDQGQFHLHYQPVVQLQTRQIRGFEALLRWKHPQRGMISADKFIEVAEDVGVTVAVGTWAMEAACRQMQAWRTKYSAAGDLTMTVNLSPKQLTHARLVEDVRGALRQAQLDPARLQLELGESTAMADPKLTREVLTELKYLGVHTSLSEFGKGQSSLAWLARFPLDELKLDRSLASSAVSERHGGDMVRVMANLGHELKVKVVAEGIESAPEMNRLEALGCDLGQGYFFSRPLEAERAEQWLQQGFKLAAAKIGG